MEDRLDEKDFNLEEEEVFLPEWPSFCLFAPLVTDFLTTSGEAFDVRLPFFFADSTKNTNSASKQKKY